MTDEKADVRSEAGEEAAKTPKGEPDARYDDDGLPLHRAPTLDDVRGSSGSGRTVAVGCAVLVTLAVLAFWLIRAGLLH